MSEPRPELVRDIMTREVVTLYEEDNLEKVEEGMQKYRFRHLPVVDDGRLVGLVTQRDILRASASPMEPGGAQRTRVLKQQLFVRDIMQSEVSTVRAETPLQEAGKIMLDAKLGCLPVVNGDGNLVGIVTEADFLKLALRLLTTQRSP